MLLKNNLRTDLNQLINQAIKQKSVRTISFFGFGKKKDESSNKSDTTELIEAKASIWEHLTEDQIEQIQNRSNLTTKERDRLIGKLSERIVLNELYQYKTNYVRNLYATFGKESGLKPGVCWPRKEELGFKKKYEEAFYPPLDQLMKELNEEKEQKAKEIKDREDEIRKGLKKLEKYKKEFFAKYNQIQSEKKEKEDKEQKRIEEICDFLGYQISPSDPRFRAAAEKKAEIERKEQLKKGSALKKTRQARLLEELQALIEKNQQEEAKKNEENKEDSKEENEIKAKENDDLKNVDEDKLNKKDKVKKKKKDKEIKAADQSNDEEEDTKSNNKDGQSDEMKKDDDKKDE